MASEGEKDRPPLAGQQLVTAVIAGDFRAVDAVLQQKQEGRGTVLAQEDLNAALLEACSKGRKFIVQKLVRFGVDVNVRMPDKNSLTLPLHVAVRQGFVDIADFLLSKGRAQVNAVDSEGNTALILAVSPAGNSDMLNLLVGHGADCGHQNSEGMTALMKIMEVMDIDGMRILMYAQPGVDKKNKAGQTARDIAVELGIVVVFDAFLEEVQTNQYRSSSFKCKALATAALSNCKEAVNILLGCRSLEIETTNTRKYKEEKENDLVVATLKELIKSICCDAEDKKELNAAKLEIAESLIASGIDVEKGYRTSYSGNFSTLNEAFIAVTRSGVYEVIKLMCGIKNMTINKERHHSPLMVAAETGRLDIIKLLLSFEADPGLRNYNGDTALTYALMHGHIECAQFLFEQHKLTEQDLKTMAKRTVRRGQLDSLEFLDLHVNFKEISQSLMKDGVLTGDTKIVRFLVDHGADVNGSYLRERPALLVALSEGKPDNLLEMVEFLVKSGAHINKTASFDSPLITVIDCNSDLDVLRYLLELGADVNEVGNYGGETPLTFALRCYSLYSRDTLSETVEVLLEAEADPNKCNRDGHTPLHLAVEKGAPRIVKQLIDAGSDLERRNLSGLTPLLQAAYLSKPEVIAVLKMCEANMKALDSDGKNALMVALTNHRCREETLSLLLDKTDQVNIQTPDGLTPLTLAALHSHYKGIALLLEAGADPHLCNNKQETALSILLDERHVRIEALPSLKLLIGHGALQSLPRAFCYPLYYRILSGDRELVQLMVTHGMAPMCLDLKGATGIAALKGVSESIMSNCSPLAAALLKDRVAIARYLLGNWFLTPSDVTGSTQIREIRSYLSNDQESESLKFLDDHFSQPMRLAQLSFVSVSAQLGDTIGREDRVRKLPLPNALQDKLLYKKELYQMDVEVQNESNSSQENNSSISMNYLMTLMALNNLQSQMFHRSFRIDYDDDDDYDHW